MKKFSLVAAALCSLAFTSCSLDDQESTQNYNLEATFEYAANQQNIDYFNSDSVYVAEYIYMDSNSCICSKTDDSNNLLGGWVLSLKKGSKAQDGSVSPYASYCGKGYDGSTVYAVFQQSSESEMPEYSLLFSYPYMTSTVYVYGAMVTNSAALADFIKTGKAQKGDYLKVVATGYKNDVEVGTCEKTLFDYSGEAITAVTDWDKWDMSSVFTNIDDIKFSIETSRSEVPAYFCMDEFCAYISLVY